MFEKHYLVSTFLTLIQEPVVSWKICVRHGSMCYTQSSVGGERGVRVEDDGMAGGMRERMS